MILQRYVLRELIAPFIISVLFFSFIMLLRQLFRIAELILEARVGLATMTELTGIIVVTLLILTVPMGALLGTLVGIGRLTSENEILAMRVAGISLPQIFLPVFVVAFLGSGLLMWTSVSFIPSLLQRLEQRQSVIQFELLTNLEPGRNYGGLAPRGADVSLFFEEKLDNQPGDGPYTLRMKQVALRVEGETQQLTGATIGSAQAGQSTDLRRESVFFAENGIIVGDYDSRSVRLILNDGILIPLERGNRIRESSVRFRQMEHDLTPRVDDDRLDRIDPRTLSLAQLREMTAETPVGEMYSDPARGRLNRPWQAYLNAKTEMYQRFTLPWSLLAFVLIAVPLAVELRPQAKTVSFFIAIGLFTLYYVMFTAAGALGMTNSPLALPAYIAPNAFIAIAGLYLFWRVQRS